MPKAHLFEISCAMARKRGAIGAFHPNIVYQPADTPEEAEGAYRKKWETLGPPVTVILRANVCPNCGQWQSVTSGDCSNECKKRGFAE